jgi:hypothetical protein
MKQYKQKYNMTPQPQWQAESRILHYIPPSHQLTPPQAAPWCIQIKIPTDFELNRANIFIKSTAHGVPYLRLSTSSRRLKEQIAQNIKDALDGQYVFHNKLFVKAELRKRYLRSQNPYYIILLSLAIQEATKLDERWYVYSLDWTIDKENPGLIIDLWQEDPQDKRICTICGRILPLDSFTSDQSDPWGRENRCKECYWPYIKPYKEQYREKIRAINKYRARQWKGLFSAT